MIIIIMKEHLILDAYASSADAATCSYGIDSRSVSIYSKEGR